MYSIFTFNDIYLISNELTRRSSLIKESPVKSQNLVLAFSQIDKHLASVFIFRGAAYHYQVSAHLNLGGTVVYALVSHRVFVILRETYLFINDKIGVIPLLKGINMKHLLYPDCIEGHNLRLNGSLETD